MENPVKNLIYSRRSIRKFTDRKLDRRLVEELVMAGCMAPSGSNIQSWRFVVVDDPRRINAICTISPGITGHPPCILVLCADEKLAETKGGTLARDQLALMDICMAAENIQLLASEYGLGSCAVKSFQGIMVKRMLNLPEYFQPHLMLVIGYPAQDAPTAPKRRPLEEILKYNVWEAPSNE